ncbi:hypothetical protein [Candidatus Azobacteroides pseudotrichonymphae]|uniref:Uncharacterized protein n=1 Tax=Azobacteroides pseudotrichonymphae genomovar. CFP2 TaxID=511995 RepID=B6YSD4_AZOPC|nr:hypothetical protein [Candidatus Azobacteroides pseudotrichonymphae]BAG84106.1 hypothetical protein CFPG_P3-20 [Candidatus Azobacteroides pseudotrichonymphae genomovar. CFP2]
MKKLLNISLLTFVFLSSGFHLANGTKIYMIHPVPPALETTIDRATFWNNEIWINWEKVEGEFYYKSEHYFRGTFWANLDGPNVVIKFKMGGDRSDTDDGEGRKAYNEISTGLSKYGVPFTSTFEYVRSHSHNPYSWATWTFAQEDVKSIKIE